VSRGEMVERGNQRHAARTRSSPCLVFNQPLLAGSAMKYSLRSLMIGVTLVCAAALSLRWALDRWRVAADREKMIKTFQDSREQILQAQWEEEYRRWKEEQETLGPPFLPKSKAPAPNPPKQ
jgi:hypothetical protein